MRKNAPALPILVLAILSGCAAASGLSSAPRPAGPIDARSPGLPGLGSALAARPREVHAFLLSLDGEMLAESYSWPRGSDDLHKLASCTKSVISILFGIAVDEGRIPSVDATLASCFPRESASWPEDKRRITLRHLLTMTDGLAWREDGSYSGPDDSFTKMKGSPDALAFLLSLPLGAEPGTRFYYNSGASHLLSAVIGKATGMSAADWAASRLFGPLGISSWHWRADPQGVTWGCDGLYMRPRDLLAIGQMLADGGIALGGAPGGASGGTAAGRRILSREWIEASTRKSIETPRGLAGRHGYGLHWWMNPFPGFSARGYGGQFLFVDPESRLVAVFFGAVINDFYLPERLMSERVMPSLASGDLRAEARDARFKKAMAAFAAQPSRSAPGKLPALARRIEGRRVVLSDGSVSVFDFPRDDEASWTLTLPGAEPATAPMGLDGRARRGDLTGLGPLPRSVGNPASLLARWEGKDVLAIELQFLYDFYTYVYRFAFGPGDEVRETCDVPEIGQRIEDISGRMEGG